MSLEGHVENGQIVLDAPTELPDGVRVRVETVQAGACVRSGTGDWAAAIQAVKGLTDYDYNAYRHQRDVDLRHAGDNWS